MRISSLLALLTSFFLTSVSMAEPFCRYDAKNYDSQGFGIPKRKGLYIVARFGCEYICSCDGEVSERVTHVFDEKYLDLALFSGETGGASRAHRYICPYSIKPGSMTPIRDEFGRIMAYNAEINYVPFPASKMRQSEGIKAWAQEACGTLL